MNPAAPPGPSATGQLELAPREHVIAAGISWTARWSLRWVSVALGLILFGLIVRETWAIVLPVLLALLICTVLEPLCAVLRDRLHLPAGLAAALALVGPLIAFVGLGFLVAPSVAGQSGPLIDATSEGLQQVQDWVQTSGFVSAEQISNVLQDLQDRIQGSAGTIASGVLSGVSAVGNAVITLVISLILTFLFLKDGRRFVPWLSRLAGGQVGPHLAEVTTRGWNTLGGFIRTQALVSFIDAVFIGAGLLIVGVPLAVPLALLTFVGGFVPIIGAFVAGTVAVLVALVSNGWAGALTVLIIVLAVQQLEGNVLSPWLQSQSMNLHAAVVLLSVMLGSGLFGIVGAFFAVPVVAVVAVGFRYLDEEVARRSLPSPETEAEPTGADEGEPAEASRS